MLRCVKVFIDDYLESPFRDESFGRIVWRWSKNPGSSAPIHELEDLADSVAHSHINNNFYSKEGGEFTYEMLSEQANPIYQNQSKYEKFLNARL